MALWLGKITLSCPSGKVVRKFTGTPDAVIKRVTKFSLPGCAVQKAEIVKRGVGAGARDRYDAENPFGGFALKDLWPFKKKPAKRHAMTRTVYMMKTKSGSYIPVDRPPNSVMAGARRRKRRRR